MGLCVCTWTERTRETEEAEVVARHRRAQENQHCGHWSTSDGERSFRGKREQKSEILTLPPVSRQCQCQCQYQRRCLVVPNF